MLSRCIGRVALGLVVTGLCPGAGLAQGPDYPFSVEHQLEETGAKLGIPPQQLLKARTALRKATQELQILHPTSSTPPLEILFYWQELDPDSAAAAARHLFGQLLNDPLLMRKGSHYNSGSHWAVFVLEAWAGWEADEAFRAVESWPPPRESFGERSHLWYRHLTELVGVQGMIRIAQHDPDRAIELLQKSQTPSRHEISARAARSLFKQGRRTEGKALIRKTLSSFPRDPDVPEHWDFTRALLVLANLDDDSFLRGFAQLAAAELPSPLGPWTYLDRAGNKIVLDDRTRTLIQVLDDASPRLREMALDGRPKLVRVIDRFGGFDSAMQQVRRFASRSFGRDAAVVVPPPGPPPRKRDAEVFLKFLMKDSRGGGKDNPRGALLQRAAALVDLLWRFDGGQLPRNGREVVARVLDGLRSETSHVEFRGRPYPGDDEDALVTERDLLAYWAVYDFDDAMTRAGSYPHREHRYHILRVMVYQLSRPHRRP